MDKGTKGYVPSRTTDAFVGVEQDIEAIPPPNRSDSNWLVLGWVEAKAPSRSQ